MFESVFCWLNKLVCNNYCFNAYLYIKNKHFVHLYIRLENFITTCNKSLILNAVAKLNDSLFLKAVFRVIFQKGKKIRLGNDAEILGNPRDIYTITENFPYKRKLILIWQQRFKTFDLSGVVKSKLNPFYNGKYFRLGNIAKVLGNPQPPKAVANLFRGFPANQIILWW